MSDRATSTVVDATVCLLLVGAAAAAVVGGAGVEPPAHGNPAAERAELLATTTEDVTYALDPPGEPPTVTANATASHRRTAHGTVAELLAEAAMSGVTVHGRRLSRAGTGFESAVTGTTAALLADGRHRSSVRVSWAPYRGAPVAATMRVGDRPPPSVDVRSATVTVAGPAGNVSAAARRAASQGGYRGVAAVVAAAVVEGLFPAEQAHLALRGDYPADRLMAARYRRMGHIVGADLRVESRPVTDLNARLTRRLTDEFTADMRRRFESPAAAARSVDTGRVRVTVRTWSP